MAKTKDTDQDITPSTTEANPAVPSGGAGIPASAFDADLAAAKEAQDADAERAKSYELPDEALTDEQRASIDAAKERQAEDERHEKATHPDQTTSAED